MSTGVLITDDWKVLDEPVPVELGNDKAVVTLPPESGVAQAIQSALDPCARLILAVRVDGRYEHYALDQFEFRCEETTTFVATFISDRSSFDKAIRRVLDLHASLAPDQQEES
ncbi:hypothetical protein [Nocardia sp. NBC_01327]|uniref:hypothetical protein n=1 Tax=Nocardia sp. NBC_01327 TaxID=2903593 RepID=UPI002E0E3F9C|nr:hypothetical protein OG326_23690 [Nocardia sp. NBC_01327]